LFWLQEKKPQDAGRKEKFVLDLETKAQAQNDDDTRPGK